MILDFKQALDQCKRNKPQKTVVISAGDEDVLEAVFQAKKTGIIDPILIDSKDKIIESGNNKFDFDNVEIIDENDKIAQCKLGMDLIRNNKATILMKGLISSDFLIDQYFQEYR